MAALDDLTNPPPRPGDAEFRRVTGTQHRAALGLILTGRASAQSPGVEQFLRFAAEQQLAVTETWAAVVNDTPVAAALLIPAAGRASMLFVSAIVDDESADMAAAVVRCMCAGQDPSQTHIVQALLDEQQQDEAEALRQAGFTSLATLVYQERDFGHDEPPVMDLPQGFTLQTWRPNRRSQFGDAIVATYEDTQDCPGLLGMRQIEDILDGHRASGIFSPDTWFLLLDGDAPAGVMLFNRVPTRNAGELVYFGLAPRCRGRGLAKRLLTHGLATMGKHGVDLIMLAVDDQNAPAKRLYASLGFVSTSRKHALICALSAD